MKEANEMLNFTELLTALKGAKLEQEIKVTNIDAMIDKVEMLAAVFQDATDHCDLLTQAILNLKEVCSVVPATCCGKCEDSNV